jgi:two-component system C4-dicarboxylate transport response regulator DctD
VATVNCAALPEAVFESELFGTRLGGFPARRQRIGRLELADRGVLFLDEIEALPRPMQAKLLRVRRSARSGPSGGRAPAPRLADGGRRQDRPGRAGRDGAFRADLFHRLNVVTLVRAAAARTAGGRAAAVRPLPGRAAERLRRPTFRDLTTRCAGPPAGQP